MGERYHQTLRNKFRKLELQYPNTDKKLLQSFAVKGRNDALGPEGLVPSAFVFGEFPPVHTKSETPKDLPSLGLRFEIANAAGKEMSEHMSRLRINRALKHNVATTFQPGAKV